MGVFSPIQRTAIIASFVVVVAVTTVFTLMTSHTPLRERSLVGQTPCTNVEPCTMNSDCGCTNLCEPVSHTCVGSSSSACSPPSAPGAPDLISDFGYSTTDNITKGNPTTYTVSCTSTTVNLYSDNALSISATCTGGSATLLAPVTAGTHTIAARQFADATCLSNTGATLSVTIDNTAPTVSAYSPTDGADSVAVGANLLMTFGEQVYGTGGNIVIKKTSDSSTVQTIAANSAYVTTTATGITVNPPSDLVNAIAYYVNVGATSFIDLAGNYYTGISDTTTWNFTTVAQCSSGACCDTSAGTYRSSSYECRAAAGTCDVAENCTGSSDACPSDVLRASSVECRASAGVCDPAENCTGSAAACPSDSKYSSATSCRASAGVCDIAETCDGSSDSCPTDTFQTSATVCDSDSGDCDVADYCTGSAASCTDTFESSGTSCNATAGACGVQDTCDGAGSCTDNGYKSTSTVCSGTNICCTGSSETCPSSPLLLCGGVAACGNGTQNGGETCDDGNIVSNDGCSASCIKEICGDGTLQPGLGEECDDGNTTSNDGCSAACATEGGKPPPPTDSDSDGVLDTSDNCVNTPNPDQADTDKDGKGNVCDSDDDGDNVLDIVDNCPTVPNSLQQDGNNNGIGDACEGVTSSAASSVSSQCPNWVWVQTGFFPWSGYYKDTCPVSSATSSATSSKKVKLGYCCDKGGLVGVMPVQQCLALGQPSGTKVTNSANTPPLFFYNASAAPPGCLLQKWVEDEDPMTGDQCLTEVFCTSGDAIGECLLWGFTDPALSDQEEEEEYGKNPTFLESDPGTLPYCP